MAAVPFGRLQVGHLMWTEGHEEAEPGKVAITFMVSWELTCRTLRSHLKASVCLGQGTAHLTSPAKSGAGVGPSGEHALKGKGAA